MRKNSGHLALFLSYFDNYILAFTDTRTHTFTHRECSSVEMNHYFFYNSPSKRGGLIVKRIPFANYLLEMSRVT